MAAQHFDISKYQWTNLEKGIASHDRCTNFIHNIDWSQVEDLASQLQGGDPCRIEAPIGLGGRHIVRTISFTQGPRWIARFRLPSSSAAARVESDLLMLQEVHCLQLLAENTSIPVPAVRGFGKTDDGLGAPFIFMDCLPGNCAMDINFDSVPQQYRAKFFKQMAKAQVEMSALTFPRIGTINRKANGEIEIGPIPGIGGPFDTASAFLRAWAATARFPVSEESIKQRCGSWAAEIWRYTDNFPQELSELADLICSGHDDGGRFPLIHTDYGHNNIVVDTEYDILGVIDWEYAIAGPWQMVHVPLTVRVVPSPMDISTNYNEDGSPRYPELQAKYDRREEYIQAVRDVEVDLDMSPRLSTVLSDVNLQNVANAMRYFTEDAKLGFYSRVLEHYHNLRSETESATHM